MFILLIIVSYVLNVIINRYFYIQLQKNNRIVYDKLDVYLILSIAPFWFFVFLLLISIDFIEKNIKIFNWFKYTPK